jgi:hypothetical protein
MTPVRTASTSRIVECPLQDEETRRLLKGEGFDLSAPITYWVRADQQHFSQDHGRIVRVPHLGRVR